MCVWRSHLRGYLLKPPERRPSSRSQDLIQRKKKRNRPSNFSSMGCATSTARDEPRANGGRGSRLAPGKTVHKDEGVRGGSAAKRNLGLHKQMSTSEKLTTRFSVETRESRNNSVDSTGSLAGGGHHSRCSHKESAAADSGMRASLSKESAPSVRKQSSAPKLALLVPAFEPFQNNLMAANTSRDTLHTAPLQRRGAPDEDSMPTLAQLEPLHPAEAPAATACQGPPMGAPQLGLPQLGLGKHSPPMVRAVSPPQDRQSPPTARHSMPSGALNRPPSSHVAKGALPLDTGRQSMPAAGARLPPKGARRQGAAASTSPKASPHASPRASPGASPRLSPRLSFFTGFHRVSLHRPSLPPSSGQRGSAPTHKCGCSAQKHGGAKGANGKAVQMLPPPSRKLAPQRPAFQKQESTYSRPGSRKNLNQCRAFQMMAREDGDMWGIAPDKGSQQQPACSSSSAPAILVAAGTNILAGRQQQSADAPAAPAAPDWPRPDPSAEEQRRQFGGESRARRSASQPEGVGAQGRQSQGAGRRSALEQRRSAMEHGANANARRSALQQRQSAMDQRQSAMDQRQSAMGMPQSYWQPPANLPPPSAQDRAQEAAPATEVGAAVDSESIPSPASREEGYSLVSPPHAQVLLFELEDSPDRQSTGSEAVGSAFMASARHSRQRIHI